MKFYFSEILPANGVRAKTPILEAQLRDFKLLS